MRLPPPDPPSEARARTLPATRLTRAQRQQLDAGRAQSAGEHVDRPHTRGDCVDGPRPCPFVACRHHLAIEVGARGALRHNAPELEVWEMARTCSLDVADAGPSTLAEVGALLNVTRERARQIEATALVQLGARLTPDGAPAAAPSLGRPRAA